MKKFYFISFACLFFTSINLYAVPAIPTPIEVTQPDGTTLTIRLYGDENFHYNTTEDGYLIAKNQQDAFVYATVSQKGELQPTERIARNLNARSASDVSFLRTLDVNKDISRLRVTENIMQTQEEAMQQMAPPPPQRATSYMGEQHLLVILVNFTDKSFVYPQSNFDNMTNQIGYNYNGGTGCVREYFMSSSYGKFKPTFDVVGPYTVSNTMAYYGQDSGGTGNDIRPAYMVVEACNLAHNDGVNFAKYDYNNDGYVDNVFIIYAGLNQAEGGPANTIWPHRWSIIVGSNVPSGTNITFDGKKLRDYGCTSELKGSSGNVMAGLGTFVHEFSHVVGLPDYYHTTNQSKPTLSYWSTMDYGGYANQSRTPPLFSAYDRFYLGWLTPEEYISGYKTLYPLSQDTITSTSTAGQAYLLSQTASNLSGGFNSTDPNPSQFFIVEYREKTGWDTYIGNGVEYNNSIATSGMVIWHIDYSKSVWSGNTVNNYTGSSQTQSSHMRVYIQPTDGTSISTPGNAFTSGSFTPKLWNNTNINRPITDITKNCTINMTFGGSPIPTPPIVMTLPATFVTSTTAKLNYNIETCTEPTSEYGLKYKKTSESNWQSSATGSLTGLSPNTEYQFYAYAATATYPSTVGEILTFTTKCNTIYTNIDITINEGDFVVFKGEKFSVMGSFNDTVVAANGCDSIIILNLIVNTDVSVIYENNIISINRANQEGATYQWLNCDNDYAPIEGATSETYTPTESGHYAVEIIYGDDYVFVSKCIEINIQSSINETEFDNVRIYPNPVKNTLFITNNENLTINNVEILDIAGKKIHTPHSSFPIPINVSHLQQGIYFIKIELSNSTTVFEKFIKK